LQHAHPTIFGEEAVEAERKNDTVVFERCGGGCDARAGEGKPHNATKKEV
jgi:hypothetical protein